MTGKVYLVGAGPGDPEYLTLQAQQCLQSAEVLIYDALIDPRILDLVPANCDRIAVGKRGGAESTPQATINQLLVEHCQQGRKVIRLKSGDPFVFGRAASELDALERSGCDYAVLPGLSTALAAPLLAGIPITDPVLSRGFAVYTVHEPDALNWEALAQLETLILLMGSRHLLTIGHELIRHGRSPDSPVALIQWAGHPQQTVLESSLSRMAQQWGDQPLSPCVIVIGEVVRLRKYWAHYRYDG
ncbi:uroporphyrinogen-III C-methyltransferase [Synechococcus elongatus]|uniref:Uroporphyrinogen-III C-methyltransferase n=2 Tax=Synechococcus elongatus TaxID=32046 RepID=SUMT_SYNE7|nr:uroporphyrinogen-III C-methyltransferase [Synechococcus elongatus]P42451.1 RecName: Full=Uroporphyrinogen-III C-methyltransferase; Short=Urogen III methylase; AltName: Full=S-adenosyl-L-methionine:uroporphyrinogen III methyltransferase; Short=SUMT; AltName: Full=Uroporphyrinogen III methylase; Short=UROM [Synechococcus elongatus PCC 7942 = FACHB-805]pir/S42533/ uroporphyrinogen III methylase - Synechococcus sp [Synechococcus sp.]ABB56303.1 uroporphyrinogen-III C-methyltransferase [Synechococc